MCKEWSDFVSCAEHKIVEPDKTLAWDVIKGAMPKEYEGALTLFVHPRVAYDLFNDKGKQSLVEIREVLSGQLPLRATGWAHNTYQSILMVGFKPHTLFVNRSSLN